MVHLYIFYHLYKKIDFIIPCILIKANYYYTMSQSSDELELRSKLAINIAESDELKQKIKQIEDKKLKEANDLKNKQLEEEHIDVLSRTIYLKNLPDEVISYDYLLDTYLIKDSRKLKYSSLYSTTCMLLELDDVVDIEDLNEAWPKLLDLDGDDAYRCDNLGTILPATMTIKQYDETCPDWYDPPDQHAKPSEPVQVGPAKLNDINFCAICNNNQGKYVNMCHGYNTCCPNETPECIEELKIYLKGQGIKVYGSGHSADCDKKW
jgi:hypothetical protein